MVGLKAVSKPVIAGIIALIVVVAAVVACLHMGQQAAKTTTSPTTTTKAAAFTKTSKTPATMVTAKPKPVRYEDVAVIIVAFETDGINILQHAAEKEILRKVRWFSSESLVSSALSEKAPAEVKKFAMEVNLTGTFPLTPKTPFIEKFKEEIKKRGGEVTGFVPYAYDAALLGVLAIIKAGTTDADQIKKALLEISQEFCGVSGYKALDPSTGDLKYQDYYIWSFICKDTTKCEFKNHHVYVASSGSIIPVENYKVSLEKCKITPENIEEYITKWIKGTKLKGKIVVGILLPASGSLAVEGKSMTIAAEMAIDQVNEILKKLGAPFYFEYVVQDTRVNPTIALQAAQVLVEQNHAVLIIGTASSMVLSGIINYVNEEKVITISPSSTSPALAMDDYVFRVVGNDREQGKALAKLLAQEGIKKVVVIYRKEAYGEGIALAFKENFEKLVPGAIVKLLPYQPDKPDYAPEVNQLASIVEELVKS